MNSRAWIFLTNLGPGQLAIWNGEGVFLGMALVLLAVVSPTDVRVGVEVTTVVAIPGPARDE